MRRFGKAVRRHPRLSRRLAATGRARRCERVGSLDSYSNGKLGRNFMKSMEIDVLVGRWSPESAVSSVNDFDSRGRRLGHFCGQGFVIIRLLEVAQNLLPYCNGLKRSRLGLGAVCDHNSKVCSAGHTPGNRARSCTVSGFFGCGSGTPGLCRRLDLRHHPRVMGL